MQYDAIQSNAMQCLLELFYEGKGGKEKKGGEYVKSACLTLLLVFFPYKIDGIDWWVHNFKK